MGNGFDPVEMLPQFGKLGIERVRVVADAEVRRAGRNMQWWAVALVWWFPVGTIAGVVLFFIGAVDARARGCSGCGFGVRVGSVVRCGRCGAFFG